MPFWSGRNAIGFCGMLVPSYGTVHENLKSNMQNVIRVVVESNMKRGFVMFVMLCM